MQKLINMKLLVLMLLFLQINLFSEDYVRNIIINNQDVLEDSVFASSLLNALHPVTKEYIIKS